MDIDQFPKTLSGSVCKLCKKKGGLCHLHGGTPRKDSKKWKQRYLNEEKEYVETWRNQQEERNRWYTPLRKDIPFISHEEWLEQHKNSPSPKKSKSPKSPKSYTSYKNWDTMLGEFIDPMATQDFPPNVLESFEMLPKPALFEIMLKLNAKQLKILCSISAKANRICKEARFRKEYNKKHYILFYGDLRQVEHIGKSMRFKDEKDNLLVIIYTDKVEGIRYVPRDQFSYIPKQNLTNELVGIINDMRVGLFVDNGIFDIAGWIVEYDNVDLMDYELNENGMVLGFLKSIGAAKWYKEEDFYWFFTENAGNEFINIVENALKNSNFHLNFENIKANVHLKEY
jgi:hypothetical protein